MNRLKGQLGTKFKSKNSWTTYKIPIFIMFWVSVWVLGVFKFWSGSQICTNLQFFFVNLELIFENIHPFLDVKMTFFKNKYRELHWKAEMILPWTLFVKFWVSEHGCGLKNGQFSISAKVSLEPLSETIRDIELKFSEILYLIDVST